jgi:hypothetical protein
MKVLSTLCVAVAVTAASLAIAGDLKSGLQAGKDIGPFDVVKVAGAVDDGVPMGKELCYRCKYGARPMVMVFARTSGKNLNELVKKLDAAVDKNSDKELAAFVNLIGEDRDSLEADAKKLATSTKAENVPIVVPIEFENGPADYGINPDADVTVILASGHKVIASLGAEELNEETIKSIVADLSKILK